MHFALVIPELHKQGGTERCTASLAEALVRRGHRFTVFANRRDPLVLSDAKWHRVPMFSRPHLPRFFSFFLAQAVARGLANLSGEHFDLVFSTGPDVWRPHLTVFHCSAAGFAELAGDASQERRGSALSRLRRWNSELSYRAIAQLEARVAMQAHAGVAISRRLKNEFERFHGNRAAHLKVIPDGVDLAEFYPRGEAVRRRVRQELNLASDAKAVLFVGHNWLRKGLPALARAVAELGDSGVVLVVAGRGEAALQRDLERMLGPQVRFLGTQKRMAEFYAAADALALPTLNEPFGLPVLEAMACGVPVIVSRAAGVAELITNGVDGLLLDDPTHTAEITLALRRILNDEEYRASLARAAWRTAEQFSWDAVAAQFEAICAEVAERSGK